MLSRGRRDLGAAQHARELLDPPGAIELRHTGLHPALAADEHDESDMIGEGAEIVRKIFRQKDET